MLKHDHWGYVVPNEADKQVVLGAHAYESLFGLTDSCAYCSRTLEPSREMFLLKNDKFSTAA